MKDKILVWLKRQLFKYTNKKYVHMFIYIHMFLLGQVFYKLTLNLALLIAVVYVLDIFCISC